MTLTQGPQIPTVQHQGGAIIARCAWQVLALVVICHAAPLAQTQAVAQDEKSGVVEGTIVYVANPQKPWRLGRYYIRNAKTGELAEAVVALSRRGLKNPDTARKPVSITVDQKDFQFVPETVAIRAGDQIKFLNSDNHPHNVKTSHPDHAFNFTMPVGSSHVETFKTGSGILQPYVIDCVFHSAMRAWVFVFDHPWFQVTGKDGRFRLQNVPAGEYRLDTVHSAGQLRARQSIVVVAGQTTTVVVKLDPSNR